MTAPPAISVQTPTTPESPRSDNLPSAAPRTGRTDGSRSARGTTEWTAPAQPFLKAVLTAFLPSGGAERSLFLSGINLMLINFIMVQHSIVAFRRAEIAVIAFSLAYFLGVSAGYLVSDRLPAGRIRQSLPVFLLVQMGLIAGLQPLHAVLQRFCRSIGLSGLGDDLGAGLLIFALLAAFVTSIYAVFLPRTIASCGGDLRRPYSVEVAGSIAGLAAMPLLAALGHTVVLGAYLTTFLALMLSVGTPRRMAALLAIVGAGFLAAFPALDRAGAALAYRHAYGWRVESMPLTQYTPYHKIEIARVDGQNRLLLNGLRQFGGDPRRTYSHFVAEFPARLLGSPRVALLGCGSMATVGRIGNFVPSIRIVDLDSAVFAASREHFRADNQLDRLRNWTFTADDAKHWLANTDETFDLILHDIPPARSRQVALTYTDDFFRLVKARLSPKGIFSISSLSSNRGEAQYGRRLLATLTSVFDSCFALERNGSIYFYGGGKGLVAVDAGTLLRHLDPELGRDARVLTGPEIRARAAGANIITFSNVGDLIYD
jgi:spermidine synthase